MFLVEVVRDFLVRVRRIKESNTSAVQSESKFISFILKNPV